MKHADTMSEMCKRFEDVGKGDDLCWETSPHDQAPKFVINHSYTDHLHDPMHNATEQTNKLKGPRGGVAVAFPARLHRMLSLDAEDDVVSWQPHGRNFCVHNRDAFVEVVMPRFFRQSKLTSFQRQLNLYGFIRLTTGRDRGAYYHPLFLRGRIDLCQEIQRTRVKGSGMKPTPSPDTEPDFYKMDPCPDVDTSCLSSTTDKHCGSTEKITLNMEISKDFRRAKQKARRPTSFSGCPALPSFGTACREAAGIASVNGTQDFHKAPVDISMTDVCDQHALEQHVFDNSLKTGDLTTFEGRSFRFVEHYGEDVGVTKDDLWSRPLVQPSPFLSVCPTTPVRSIWPPDDIDERTSIVSAENSPVSLPFEVAAPMNVCGQQQTVRLPILDRGLRNGDVMDFEGRAFCYLEGVPDQDEDDDTISLFAFPIEEL